MKKENVLILILIFILNFNIGTSINIYIDYESKNNQYDNYQCGGFILNISTPYCVSFRDAGIRANYLANITSSLSINVIINDLNTGLQINEFHYLGYLLYFENITISIVDKNLNKIKSTSPKFIINGSYSKSNFIVTSDSGKKENNKRSNILIQGIEFSNWNIDHNGYGLYPLVLNSTIDNVVLDNVVFSNSNYLTYFGLPVNEYLSYDTKQVYIRNCKFKNSILRNFYIKSININIFNSTFQDNLYGFESNSQLTIFNHCAFINNNIKDNEMALINNYNNNSNIQILNSVISNNTISMLLSFDFENITTKCNINLTSCSIINNKFYSNMSKSYLINVKSPSNGWIINIKDTIIKRSSNSSTSLSRSDGLIGIPSSIGIITLENLSIENYSFKKTFNINKDLTTLIILNSALGDSSINYENNTISTYQDIDINHSTRNYQIYYIPLLFIIFLNLLK